MSEKILSAIKISELKSLISEEDGYLAIYEPQSTLLLFDKKGEHQGSIYCREKIVVKSRDVQPY